MELMKVEFPEQALSAMTSVREILGLEGHTCLPRTPPRKRISQSKFRCTFCHKMSVFDDRVDPLSHMFNDEAKW